MNTLLLAAAYLAVALGLENGVFPLLGESFGVVNWGEMHLVASGVILAGCLRGEVQGLVYALIASVVAGSLPGPGYIGPTVLSFAAAAFGGALAAQWFFMDRFGVRFVNLYGLLIAESLIRSGVHQMFWGGLGPQALWGTNFVLALFLAGIYKPLKQSLDGRSIVASPSRRRKLARGR
jgi:hypothetical protein